MIRNTPLNHGPVWTEGDEGLMLTVSTCTTHQPIYSLSSDETPGHINCVNKAGFFVLFLFCFCLLLLFCLFDCFCLFIYLSLFTFFFFFFFGGGGIMTWKLLLYTQFSFALYKIHSSTFVIIGLLATSLVVIEEFLWANHRFRCIVPDQSKKSGDQSMKSLAISHWRGLLCHLICLRPCSHELGPRSLTWINFNLIMDK